MLTEERRSVDLVDADLKGRQFRGYAAVFDSPWNEKLIEAAGYVEKLSRGVFRKALSLGDDVPLLLGHERNMMLATTKTGNLRLQEDGKGLLAEAKLPDNYLGEYARSLIESGDLGGMSYGISLDPKKDTMLTKDEAGVWTRTVVGVKRLLDVTLTWEPAYSATGAELRSENFVASPLQELLGGAEPQTEAAVAEAPPDDEPGWWGDDPDEEVQNRAAAADPLARYRSLYIDQLGGGTTNEK